MQIDAHTSFAKNWDEILKKEWKNTENEFGIITTVPPPKDEQDVYQPGGTKEKEVPRQCLITYNDNGVPVSDIEGVHYLSASIKSHEFVVSLVCLGSCVSFFIHDRITSRHRRAWLLILTNRFFRTAGRPPFRLPSATLKKVYRPTRLHRTPSRLSSFLVMRDCGLVGKFVRFLLDCCSWVVTRQYFASFLSKRHYLTHFDIVHFNMTRT